MRSKLIGLFLCLIPIACSFAPTDCAEDDLVCNPASLALRLAGPVEAPSFSPGPGHYSAPQYIAFRTATPGASVYYTTDGTTPTTASIPYTEPVHVWKLAGRTIKLIAVRSGSTSAVSSGTFSYPPLSSAQTLCYDGLGGIIACAGTNQDGETQTGVPRSFTGPTAHAVYTSDYTTTDDATGLVWRSCPQGVSGATCATGSPQGLPNDGSGLDATNHPTYGCNALNSANGGAGYAGITSWRVPTKMEVDTLINYGVTVAPAINTAAFPNTPSAGFWSSTTVAATPANAWYITHNNSQLINTAKTGNQYVRCVSGPPSPQVINYTDMGDGTVKDNSTGLYWQKCAVGQTNDAVCSGAASAASVATLMGNCIASNVAGRTWRLPNIQELKTLMDSTTTAAVKISSVFPNPPANIFWTTTSLGTAGNNGLYILFTTGIGTGTGKGTAYNGRCVSGP